jgi:uncharacterized repeat protein (TIGR04002 family)
MQKDSNKTKYIVLAALFAAIIFVVTAYIHVPSHNGYTHVGDAFIYLAGALLPTPYAVAAGAIGAALADGLTGYAMWMVPSIIIKSLTALLFTNKTQNILCLRNVLALIPSFVLCAGGYYLAEVIMVQNWVAPLAGIPGYCIQVSMSAVLFVGLSFVLDRMGFKRRVGLQCA